jgi:hypothetical protein
MSGVPAEEQEHNRITRFRPKTAAGKYMNPAAVFSSVLQPEDYAIDSSAIQ